MSGTSSVYSYGFYSSTCGYCGSEEDSSSRYGVTALSLNCKDYQDLIDRGWRRSGTYVYKPHMKECCCPQYTIRMDVNKFVTSKSQRKLINRFNRYIEGTFDPTNKDDDDGNAEIDEPLKDKSQQNTSKAPKKKENVGFDLKNNIHEAENRQDWKHHLRIVFEKSSFSREKYELYCKYQINIHHDKPYEVTERGFQRFLVDSPLNYEPSNNPNMPEYGSFHQCYYLDDKLIAVAVLDILPKCVSSVYLLYDPDYNFLQIGKYSSLREIAMAQELCDVGLKDLHWYYMGYYIHTCQKMKYKGQYKPSFLLDPETYEWYPYEQCVPLLDKHNYVSFANPSTANSDNSNEDDAPPGMLNPEKVTDEDIKNVIVNYMGLIKRFHELPDYLQRNERVRETAKDYFAAVGKELAERMALMTSFR